MIASIRMKRVGIRYFERRSMPCCTPSATVPHVITRKTKCQPTLRYPSETKFAKCALRASASEIATDPVTASKRYATHQPPTTE